ncbi:MAG TPA: twin-arginine translocation pathway signal protein, partial [Opitutus sp.]|nr:twin-arginine translocation pathway signal protein [Opitutus sp.]
TAAPLFVMGSRVNAGVHGTAPSLRLERNQDLAFSTDFRRVYATMLDQWLACPSTAVLGREYGALPLIA